MRKLERGARVRRWNDYGVVLEDSTHYALIAWDGGAFEEVEQLDLGVEVEEEGDLEGQIEHLQDEREEYRGYCECDDNPGLCEQCILANAAQDELDALEPRLERLYELDLAWALEQGRRRHAQATAPRAGVRRIAA